MPLLGAVLWGRRAGSEGINPPPDFPTHPFPKLFSRLVLTCAPSCGGPVQWLSPPSPGAAGPGGRGGSRAALPDGRRRMELGQGRAQLLQGIYKEDED